MARLKAASVLIVQFLSQAPALQYQLIQEYNASNIFEEFNFFNGSDPTGGFVQYVPFDVAANTQLIGNGSDQIYLGVDSSNIYTPGGPGRPSVRIESKLTFTEGLFVIDLLHVPVGCGTWLALWTTGLSSWPADGEIGIIENVNDARSNNAAIHAKGECSVLDTANQTGTWKSTDCIINHDDNQGCGTVFTEPASFGADFNTNGGGVYAMEWTSSSIRSGSSPLPDSDTFGAPSASVEGPCSASFGEKFFNHSIVIDTTFCGGWAGGTFGTGTSAYPLKEGLGSLDSCVDYVASNPGAFTWGV
ncbi:hypothetical protein BU23DRAFT_588682 [Bimuria novae-zelandiae CBS 107.79]|uniref:GH16 domain-containing protein n=1 Tax=Bimuria novae-zelandiae CBS 107.79 TaxID=1447943 RepID=A0A6A5VPY0_9PLEO|nr:hypothetical protein BU23DRAFT_588682 [Bimuria novae-zelandiae CBS 107.79]